MEINEEILYGILDAYAYEIVFVDRTHIVRYMNKVAKQRYGDRVKIGNSLFNCHNENSKRKMASTTKIMTAIVVIENVKDLNKTVTISSKSAGVGGSRLRFTCRR